jgi:hypothetical protein
MEKEREREKT